MYMNQNELYIDKVVNIPIAENETQDKLVGGTGTTSYTFTFSPPVGYRSSVYTANLMLLCTGFGSLNCETYMNMSGTYRPLSTFPFSSSNVTFSKKCTVTDYNGNTVNPSDGGGSGNSTDYTFTYDLSSYVRVA